MMSEIARGQRANAVGAMWMVFAMAIFALEDALMKLTTQTLPIGQALILFGLGGAILFAVMSIVQKQPVFVRDVLSKPMKIRLAFEILGRLFFLLALTVNPLSLVTAILQATPLVVVGGAAIFLGERVGWRRWISIFLGLTGVMIVLRPTTDGISFYAVTAVLGMIGFAGRDLASRAAPKTLSNALLGLYGFLAIIVAGVIFSLWDGQAYIMPDRFTALCLTGATVGGFAAYGILMKAMRMGDVAMITPFRYSRLIFGLACGVFIFGETLDGVMMVGCALIVLSGLFVLQRGAQK
jgi:drug/metabolite transporter (DMT)-like permease